MLIDKEPAVSGEGESKETGRVKCPLMTVHDLDCIEDCGNVTCKHWKGENNVLQDHKEAWEDGEESS